MKINRTNDWIGWSSLPIAQEGHTGKYPYYQTYIKIEEIYKSKIFIYNMRRYYCKKKIKIIGFV